MMKNIPTNRQIQVNRNLYNTKFEGYKLNLNTDIKIIHHNLPSKVDVNCVKTYSHTPFKIIEARNRLNFVFKNPWYSYSFFYIDESYCLIYILIDQTTYEATYFNLFKIDEPADEDKNEFPTIAFVNENLMVISDGAFNGKIYVINFSNKNKIVEVIKIISKKKLLSQDNYYEQNVYPINLMYAKLSNDKKKIFLLGYTYNNNININSPSPPEIKKVSKNMKTEFYVSLCEIVLETSNNIEASNDLKLISATKCNNSPIYGSIEDYIIEMKNNTNVINEGNYIVISENDAFHEYISVINENENDNNTENDGNVNKNENNNKESMIIEKQTEQLQNQQNQHPNIYKWCQEMDDITLYLHTFELDKRRINCKFKRNKIELSVLDNNNEIIDIFDDELWDEVIPEECIWTVEKNKAKNGSIITLHFEKKNQVHWIQMFKEDDNVLETVDPSELANIKERLLMFTGKEDNGLYQNINSIQQIEECDMEKSPISFIRVSQTGQITDINQGSGFEWLCTSFPTLETPYYMSMTDDNINQNEPLHEPYITNYLCLKQDVDGIILKLENNLEMNHCAVFNAFGFVEASKRNKKFAYISNDFRYALIVETSKLVFVYSQPSDEESKRNSASQYLIDVSNYDDSQMINDKEHQKEELIYGVAQLDQNVFMVLKRSSFCIFSIDNEQD